MKSTTPTRFTLLLAALAIHLSALCGSAEPEPVTTQVAGGPVQLRVRRTVGKSMIYEGSLDREQRGNNSYHESNQFYLNTLCASREDGRDMLAQLRTHLSRKRIEKHGDAKQLEMSPMNSTELIDLGPNYTTVGTLRCYGYDMQNRIAYRTMQLLTLTDGSQFRGTLAKDDERKITFISDDEKGGVTVGSMEIPREKIARMEPIPMPHVCINEAPHYLFPIFPERAVNIGDTWKFRIPTIIPLEQGLMAKILPTQFDIMLSAKLRDIRAGAGGRVAVIDYSIDGVFDTTLPEFKARFAEDFHVSNKITHKVSGNGICTLDLERGWMLDRSETFTFFFYGLTQQPPEQKFDKNGKLLSEKPRKPAESKAEITSRFSLKLLMPGTRLKSGAAVPPYE